MGRDGGGSYTAWTYLRSSRRLPSTLEPGEDRAGVGRAFTRTRVDERSEAVTLRGQGIDSLLHVLQALGGMGTHGPDVAGEAEAEEEVDLGECEPETLRAADEQEPVRVLGCVSR